MARTYNWRAYVAPGADPMADPATWVWEDVTAFVRLESGVVVERGKKDQFSVIGPQRATLTVDNRDGRWIRRNPLGAWSGLIRRNMPLQLRLVRGVNEYVRFTGLIDALPSRRSVAGRNRYVPLTASGITRRLGQGNPPLRSALARAIPTSSPVAYWSFEDGSDSEQAASGVLAGSPMVVKAGSVRFAATTGPAGSAPLPAFSSGGTMVGSVPTIGASTTEWRMEFVALFNTFEAGAFGVPLQWLTGGTIALWELVASQDVDGGLGFEFIDVNGAAGGPVFSSVRVDDGLWHHFRVDAVQSGSNIALTVTMDGTTIISNSIVGETVGPVAEVIVNPTGDTAEGVPSLGHVAVWAPFSGSVDTVAAAIGYLGEQARDRVVRLCGEQGVAVSATAGDSEPMGPQLVSSFMALLRECEATDGGLLYEARTGELTYLRREERYNQAVSLAIDYDQRHIAPPFEPADDDRELRNDVVASRPGGSSGHYVDAVSVAAEGRYEVPLPVNPQSDGRLDSLAAWASHLGTVDVRRWPALGFQIARWPDALIEDWLDVDLGARTTVANVPEEDNNDGLVDLWLGGYTETCFPHIWRVSANCPPAAGWTVGVRDDTDLGRRDTAGSELASGALLGATTLSVTTTLGPLWTTGAVDFDIGVADLRIHVTNISGTGPQTLSVTGAHVLKALSSGEPVSLWRPARRAL